MMRFECAFYGVRSLLFWASGGDRFIVDDLQGNDSGQPLRTAVGKHWNQYNQRVPSNIYYHALCGQQDKEGKYY